MRAPRMTRALASAAAALAVAALAGACDTSPVAASVNGTEIKQTALDQQVRLEVSNKPFVAAVQSQAAASDATGIVGDAPGSYSAGFIAEVLSTLVGDEAVHQHLAAAGQSPDVDALAAARSVQEAEFGPLWLSFPASYRDAQVQAAAEHALVEPPVTAAGRAQLAQVFAELRRYFFSQVCVRTVSVALSGSGGFDPLTSRAQAQQLSDRYNQLAEDPGLAATLGTPQGGQVTCYDGAGLEAQGASLLKLVLSLAPGHASAPIPQPYGDEVVQIASREEQPFSPAVAAALALVISETRGSPDPAYDRVVSSAHVTVDPQYGSWAAARGEVIPSSPLGANSSASAGQPGATP